MMLQKQCSTVVLAHVSQLRFIIVWQQATGTAGLNDVLLTGQNTGALSCCHVGITKQTPT